MSDPPESNATTTLIPAGHTFLNSETFVTVEAADMTVKLLEQAGNRNPDVFDMYIHHDYYAYGVFDLVDKTLSKLGMKIRKNNWKEAFPILEALTTFVECESVWTQSDDVSRVMVTRKVIGAVAIAALQGLLAMADFNASSFPSIENLLQRLSRMSDGGQVCSKKYGPLFVGIGRRLFSGKTKADFARERGMLKEYVRTMNDEVDKKNLEEVGEMAEERSKALAAGEPLKPWFDNGAAGTKIRNELKFARIWKEYKEYLLDVPKKPLMGPPKWDLTTWTKADKIPYHFGEVSDSEEE